MTDYEKLQTERDELLAEVKRLREGIRAIYEDVPPSELKARLGRLGSQAPKSRQPTRDLHEWLKGRD